MKVYDFKDKTDELDAQFAEYLKDKSVAVVGVAALDDMEQGELIDSHDVVVRIHYAVPYEGYCGTERNPENYDRWYYPPFIPPEWQSRIGKRVNVFYHKEFVAVEMPKLVDAFREAGGEFLCLEYGANLFHYDCCNVRKVAPCRYLTNDHFLNVMEVVEDVPLAGSLIIGDILRHDIKSLYLTGCPTNHQPDGRLCTDDRINQNEHMFFKNFNWLHRLYDNYDNIYADPHMTDLFHLIPQTWDEYAALQGLTTK